MFYRRPSRFADYLTWECIGRPLSFGLISLAGFVVCLFFSEGLGMADALVASLGILAAFSDAAFRFPRFSRDFSLIRELESWHRKADLMSLIRAELLVWNGQYVLNFGLGIIGSLLVVEQFLGSAIETAHGIRAALLFAAVFYLANALFWRLGAHRRVMAFLKELKVDFREQSYG